LRKISVSAALSALFLFGPTVAVPSETVRIVAPYAGILSDAREEAGAGEFSDTGFLTGLYFQWVDTESYQWNSFVYYAPDVNYSSVLGGHFIFDKFVGPDWSGRFVVGAGLEAIRIDTDAGDAFESDGLTDFRVATSVLVPYLRAGKYLKAASGPAAFSVLPWVGVQPQWSWGDLDMEVSVPFPPPPHAMEISDSFDDYELYGIAGVNLKVTLFRFVDLEAKYQGTFNASDFYSTVNGTAYAYLNRSWGLSYRFKYMEASQGTESYHIFGVAYVF
jgi:hypothetical protein